MNFVPNSNYIRIGIVVFIFAIMCFLTYLAFRLSELIVEKIGYNIIKVIEKIMGLILAIIGIDMIIQGIKLSFQLI